ncbi:POSSIBLE PROTEIN OF NUCLEAR SCAFFOLD [Encephalitozoon cuniculi GB-M1]|uniref:POSSIBLE PROTEIN OF NUCLEAR SCAFFOLD n=3 Tax=Encephalitozoon cuniculi TaxID=6035 RepID=Q8SQV4_ENCCU|nr:uncharacterized protein ECU11_1160 [Encephalitozoon cuniculi GB-M1]AGE94878.1 putative nuclear scaffold protein [Encephalitozoon cuniculi]KMV65074.1 hypothetical protein M970_111150 [Encephalitozoon cuniculi EcunIII-L]UYI26320.1 cell division protein 27-like protein [Encephalitozoon cuniculi]CAD26026.1 POSSIBLE PROTEIN OF NUCLEAR SCAFFOLD [Encephalitozoon cuniculi GB-M1]
MDSKLIGKICKSIRYRDYETAIFLAACLLPCKPEYRMLMSIVLYLNGEYTRALFHLHKLNTCTSKYYESLCYKKKKDYKKAIKSLESILEGKVERDPDVDARIQEMFVDPGDEEFFESLLGDLCTLSGYREEGIGHYVRSFGKSFLFSPVENLLLENKVPQKRDKENVRQTGRRGIEEEYVSDSIEFHESLSPSLVKKYMEHVPGIGSYFISNAARRYFNLGMNDKSKACFELVRRKDPMFLHNVDYYSTILWHSKDVYELGMLCKNLIKHAPDSPNTWKALGNFYSHQGDYQRSVLCFKRSLCIEEDSYTYTLLGYESIQRNEYDIAMKYFNLSLKMLGDNYRAMFGCGLVYTKTEKLENAEFFLKKAIETNPRNLQIKVHAMKFYTRKGLTDQSIRLFKEAFHMEYTDIHRIVECILSRKGSFSDVEEFLLLEFVEILVLQNLSKLAADVLSCVEYRGESYSKKKELVMDRTE